MLDKPTLRTGNDGVQFYFHKHNSPLNALSNTDGNNASNSSPVADCNCRSDAKPCMDAIKIRQNSPLLIEVLYRHSFTRFSFSEIILSITFPKKVVGQPIIISDWSRQLL